MMTREYRRTFELGFTTYISEPSNFPVSAYKLVLNLMLLDSNLLVSLPLLISKCKENLFDKKEKLVA